MAPLSLSFVDQNSCIRAVGDVPTGWQECKDGYGFFGLGYLEFRGGWRIRVALQVRARPNHQAYLAKVFPENLKAKHAGDHIYYQLEGRKLEAVASMGPNIKWLEGAGKPGINWRPDTPILTGTAVRFYVTLLAVFTAHYASSARVSWEHDLLPFFSGGRVESNRRKF
jgi:hypothetical protein